MAFAQLAHRVKEPVPIDSRAADNLRFIRDTMERAASFTAVPGWGGVVIGISAVAAGAIAYGRSDQTQFFIWLIEAAVALTIGIGAVLSKSRRLVSSLQSKAARRALLSFMPPLVAGAVLTVVLVHIHDLAIVPGLWLLLYGAAVVTGGAFSVRIVPFMGLCFMALGIVSLAAPAAWDDLFLTLGFGVIHIAFGIVIARRHGG
ncbi:MAG: hypothetical protein M3Y57_06555 [Acidobacteriota bacterium]|nr:hypothetical protein [Acidobacteriota bacterium]